MRVRIIQGTRPNSSTPESALIMVDGEPMTLLGEGINALDVSREMQKLRDEGHRNVGMPISPPIEDDEAE